MVKGQEDRNTIDEIIARLMEDFNLPDNDEGRAIALLVAYDISHGYEEAEPLQKRYASLLCSWCGKAHFSNEHQKLSDDFAKRQLKEGKNNGWH